MQQRNYCKLIGSGNRFKFLYFRVPCLKFLAFLCTLLSAPSFGRFYHLDAPELDDESKRSDEYFNDVLSYRENPITTPNKNRITVLAGSLNAKRFYYRESINFEACNSLCVEIVRRRDQDTVDESDQMDLAISGSHQLLLSPGVMASIDSHKDRADLGARTTFNLGPWQTDFKVWSVDHYFNSKKENPSQYFATKAKSIELSSLHSTPTFDLEIIRNWDFPLLWVDDNDLTPNLNSGSAALPENRRIAYRYDSHTFEASILGKEAPMFLHIGRRVKNESFQFFNTDGWSKKDFHRDWRQVEVWWMDSAKNGIFYALDYQSIRSTYSHQTINSPFQISLRQISQDPISPTQNLIIKNSQIEEVHALKPSNTAAQTAPKYHDPHHLRSPHRQQIASRPQLNSTPELTHSKMLQGDSKSFLVDNTPVVQSTNYHQEFGFRWGRNYNFTANHSGVVDATTNLGGHYQQIKVGSHYIYLFNPKTSLRLIVTWDLDKAYRSWKKNEIIRLWGGGGLSLQAEL